MLLAEFEKVLAARFPSIPWREPIKVSLLADENDVRLGCRICIARWGLRGEGVCALPRTADEFDRHMCECHAEAAPSA